MFKKIVILFIAVCIVVVVWFVDGLFRPHNPLHQPISLAIPAGATLRDISEQLHDDGVIGSRFIFENYAKWRGVASQLQAGDYQLHSSLTILEVINALQNPSTVNEATITVIEGWTNEQIGEALVAASVGGDNQFFNLAGHSHFAARSTADVKISDTWRQQFPFLATVPEGQGLEGYLFPDTYRVYQNASTSDVLAKMLENFGNKLTPDLQSKIKKGEYDLHQVVTLASVIEKEVRSFSDKKMVADIFYKRLKIGQALQADSTVNYANGKSEFFTTGKDRDLDSLYNTYKYPGLPPGPIGNPGLESLQAAIEPTPNDYYYFLTDAKGRVYYATTYDQHLANVNKYLR